MIVFLQGRFVRSEEARISIYDRGFLYGDGLFETLRAYNGKLFLWEEHMKRLFAGCDAMRIHSPLSGEELKCAVRQVLLRNHLRDAILRLNLSRGAGQRGYSPRDADYPTLSIVPFAAPAPLSRPARVITSSIRLFTGETFSQFKHTNKVVQVLARAEADEAEADEALLLDEKGQLMEGTGSNLFWIASGTIFTPPPFGIVPGISRGHVLRICELLQLKTAEKKADMDEILQSEGVFLTSTGSEVQEIGEVDGKQLPCSPIIKRIKEEFLKDTSYCQ